MPDARTKVLTLFRQATDRPVYWASERTSRGDFDGRDTTLEVFDVLPLDEWTLALSLRDLRRLARSLLGRPVSLMFHTPAETTRLYPWAREPTLRENARRLVRPAAGFASGGGFGSVRRFEHRLAAVLRPREDRC